MDTSGDIDFQRFNHWVIKGPPKALILKPITRWSPKPHQLGTSDIGNSISRCGQRSAATQHAQKFFPAPCSAKFAPEILPNSRPQRNAQRSAHAATIQIFPIFSLLDFSGLRNFQNEISMDTSRDIAFYNFDHWVIKGLKNARIWKPIPCQRSDRINLALEKSVIQFADAPHNWQQYSTIRKIFRLLLMKLSCLATNSSLTWWRESVQHTTHLVFATVKHQDTCPPLTTKLKVREIPQYIYGVH